VPAGDGRSPDGRRRCGHPTIVYFSPEFGISELGAAVLGRPRHPGRRPPQGGQRPRHRSAPSGCSTARASSARVVDGEQASARDLRRHRPRCVDTGSPSRSRSATPSWRPRCGGWTWAGAAAAARHRPAATAPTTGRSPTALQRRSPPPARTGARARRRRRPRRAAVGWTPGCTTSTRATPGSWRFELLDRELTDGAPTIAAARDRHPPARAVHHPHAGAGRHRPLRPRRSSSRTCAPWSERWEAAVDELLALGADPDDGLEVFNMAALCLRIAEGANGVSKLHGEVSRELFAGVPGGERIGSVTNGVHARTWVTRCRTCSTRCWARVGPTATRGVVVGDRARRRSPRPCAARPAPPSPSCSPTGRRHARSRRTGDRVRPPVRHLQARHAAAAHPELLAELLGDDDARSTSCSPARRTPPTDGARRCSPRSWHGSTAAANGRFTFVPDYDMGVARAMYAGCDVWLNNPVRPHEASGTSGEKAALNGALNCSIRDGWWAEMSDGRNGWDIPLSTSTDPDVRDDEESASHAGAARRDRRRVPRRRARARRPRGSSASVTLGDPRPAGDRGPHGPRLRPSAVPPARRRPALTPRTGSYLAPGGFPTACWDT
jgi:hypothetical protein